MHYPPICRDFEIKEFTDVLKEFGVKRCYYGHLHAESIKKAFTGYRNGIDYILVSADAVNFTPIIVSD